MVNYLEFLNRKQVKELHEQQKMSMMLKHVKKCVDIINQSNIKKAKTWNLWIKMRINSLAYHANEHNMKKISIYVILKVYWLNKNNYIQLNYLKC